MNKKTIAYVLIGAGVLAAIYYFYTKMRNSATAAGLGAGAPDNRGAWAADDDAAYAKMVAAVKAQKESDLGWIHPLVETNYTTGPGFHNIKGQASKAGAFLSVLEAVNPNPAGTYTGNQSGGNKQLYPDAMMTNLWQIFNTLKVKHGGL